MASLAFSLILQTAVLASGAQQQDYSQAFESTLKTGRPLVVFVGADWCSACQEMKQSTLPKLRKTGILRKVAFAVVNTDRQSRLAEKLMKGSTIPQLIMYRKTSKGWKRTQLTGFQNEKKVESFIAQAIRLQKDEMIKAKTVSQSKVAE